MSRWRCEQVSIENVVDSNHIVVGAESGEWRAGAGRWLGLLRIVHVYR